MVSNTGGHSARRPHVPSRAHSAGTSDDAAGPKLRSVRLRSGITYPDLFRFGWAGRVADNVSSQRDAAASFGVTRGKRPGVGARNPGEATSPSPNLTGGLSPSRCPGYPPGSRIAAYPGALRAAGHERLPRPNLVGCNRREPYCTEPLGRWVQPVQYAKTLSHPTAASRFPGIRPDKKTRIPRSAQRCRGECCHVKSRTRSA